MDQFNKKISKSGAITLPKVMRRDLGINENERFNISTKNNGEIVLKRVNGDCVFCKGDDDLIVHMGRFVCKKCIQIMSERKVD